MMKKILFMVLAVLMIVVTLSTSVSSIEFRNEVIHADLTDFYWAFDNPFGSDYPLFSENIDVYIDNLGCAGVTGRLYVEIPVTSTERVCDHESSCVDVERIDVNGTWTEHRCSMIETCTDVIKTEKQLIDVERTDVFMTADSRFVYKGKRTAYTNSGVCDMNFRHTSDDGLMDFDVVDFGRLWWNSTWIYKRPFDIAFDENITNTTAFPFKFVLNSSNIDYSKTNNDGTDVRCVNSGETATLPSYVELWNESGTSIIYCKVDITNTTNTTGYIYYGNAAAGNVSDFNATFTDELGVFYSWNVNNDDLSDTNSDNTVTGATHTDHYNESNDRAPGFYTYDGDNDYIKDTNARQPDIDGEITVSFWMYPTRLTDQESLIRMWNGEKTLSAELRGDLAGDYMYVTCFDSVAQAFNLSTPVGEWVHVAFTCDHTSKQMYGYLNGAIALDTVDATIDADDDENTYYWGIFDDALLIRDFYGRIDEGRIYTDVMNQNFIDLLAGQPDFTLGAESSETTPTSLTTGLLNSSYANISLLIDEEEFFFVFANYTYDLNGSSVYPNAWCNYSADEIEDLYRDWTPGTNTTLCTAGCDSANRTGEFTGLHTSGYNSDDLIFDVCHNTAATRDFTIATSCGSTYLIDSSNAPICSNGFTRIVVMDANCSSDSEVNLSIWSAGVNLAQSLVLVNDMVRLDRSTNHTSENLTYNVTNELWLSELHMYKEHGSKSIDVDCQSNLSGVENETDSISVVVVNVAPSIFIDTIWWWLESSPVVFTDLISAKYPLQNTLNITGGCVDDDLFNAGVNLTYGNGTLIHSEVFTATGNNVPSSVNFTQGNFSTESSYLSETDFYVFTGWCNDTSNNVTYESRSFYAGNDPPTGSWDNSSGSYNTIPLNFTWTCTDAESETMDSYVFVNTTLNETNSPDDGNFNFNYPENYYNLTLFCEDSFFNSTADTILVTYSQACAILLDGLIAGERYNDNEVTVGVSCSNGAAVSSCGFTINRFAFTNVSNCTSELITLEKGWNHMNFTVNQGLASESSSIFSVWARDYDADIFDYVALWLLLIVFTFFWVLAEWTGMGVYGAIAAVFGLLIGYEVLAIAWAPGVVLMIMLPVASLIYTATRR